MKAICKRCGIKVRWRPTQGRLKELQCAECGGPLRRTWRRDRHRPTESIAVRSAADLEMQHIKIDIVQHGEY